MSKYYETIIELYKYIELSGSYAENPIILESITSWNANEGIKKVKDSFDINLNNYNNKYNVTTLYGDGVTTTFSWYWNNIPEDFTAKAVIKVNNATVINWTIIDNKIVFTTPPAINSVITINYSVINYEDRISILQKKKGTPTSDDLIIEGLINDIKGTSDYSSRNINISGVGLIELFFNTLVFSKSYTEDGDAKPGTVIDILTGVINQVNNYNSTREVNFIAPSTKSDGTSFPQRTYYESYKRALDIIEDLSGDDYTEDGAYYYYVRYNKVTKVFDLFWRPKAFSETYNAELITEGIEPVNMKFSVNDDEVYQAIIYNCGANPSGAGMEFLYFGSNNSTFNSGGSINWYYMTETSSIGDNILNAEFESRKTSWEQSDEGKRISSYPTVYPYTFGSIRTRNPQTYEPLGGSITVNDDDEFLDAVENEAQAKGWFIAKKFVEQNGMAKRHFDIQIPFESMNIYPCGEIINVTSESFNQKRVPLRIMERTIEEGIMVLRLEEDEVTVVG